MIIINNSRPIAKAYHVGLHVYTYPMIIFANFVKYDIFIALTLFLNDRKAAQTFSKRKKFARSGPRTQNFWTVGQWEAYLIIRREVTQFHVYGRDREKCPVMLTKISWIPRIAGEIQKFERGKPWYQTSRWLFLHLSLEIGKTLLETTEEGSFCARNHV